MPQDSDTVATLLIIEDDPIQAMLLNHCLEKETYRTIFAKDGPSALTMMRENKPDLVLCDWIMPGMTGIEVCQKIKSNPDFASTIFILLTGKSSLEDQVFGLEAGADDFLNKPVEKNQLLARIHAGLRQKQLYKQLQTTNKELKAAQAQLIQTKKMSSLSKVVAGIAHEINNPISFIHGNIRHAQGYFKDLLALIELFRRTYPEPPEEVASFIEEIELEYITNDIPQLLDSMENGSERVRDIIKSLRTFAGLDESSMKSVSLQECIDNTLSLVEQQLQGDDIQIVRKYSDLPRIHCNFRDINQALMNIFTNAIDVIKDKKQTDSAFQGCIEIATTQPKPNVINISIMDNGNGVDAEIFEKIFDPFFTTKQVGDGMGLGLSVAYRIIQDHQGQLFCNSYPSVGAEFVISLPILVAD
ncbi:MAG: response regulator [Limnothrix sp. RL_2_0]|nr:response regulator [Limnothrix sp. RL_2_0]